MDDILSWIIGIFIVSILMFIFPLMVMADRADDLSQLTIQIATTEFVDEIRTIGKITNDAYNNYIYNLSTTGNTYNIEMTVKVLDENPAHIVIEKNDDASESTGQNLFYSIYTSQIEKTLEEAGELNLKEGDVMSVSVKNTNLTLKQQLNNFFYIVTGNETYTIAASHSGIVATTGI